MHLPRITHDLRRIFGCTCGWLTPQDARDSDATFTWHAAIVSILETPPGAGTGAIDTLVPSVAD
jgi:hypothetical protein